MNNLEDYIDFGKIWDDAQKDALEYLDEIDDYIETKESIEMVKEFIKNPHYSIEDRECSLDGNIAYLVFGESGIGANESDTQGSFVCITIGYSFDDESLCSFDYEQG